MACRCTPNDRTCRGCGELHVTLMLLAVEYCTSHTFCFSVISALMVHLLCYSAFALLLYAGGFLYNVFAALIAHFQSMRCVPD